MNRQGDFFLHYPEVYTNRKTFCKHQTDTKMQSKYAHILHMEIIIQYSHMKKFVFIALLLFIASTSFGQESKEYYTEGVEFFKKDRYKEADSLFSIAIRKLNKKTYYLGANLYYDRGTTRWFLKDTSGFCSDMKTSATSYSDKGAERNYKTYCLKYNEEAYEYFKAGYHEFNLKNYKASDSLLTLSIEKYPFVDNIYLRGVAKLYMLDTNSFCSDMQKISAINEQAKKNVQQFCKNYKSLDDAHQEEITESKEEHYMVPDVMPKFNGKGKDAFRKFLQANIRYPKEARKKGIKGRVFVQIVIDRDGEVKHASIVKSGGEILDREVMRVVNLSPKWTPGLQDGKPVSVSLVFPVVFE